MLRLDAMIKDVDQLIEEKQKQYEDIEKAHKTKIDNITKQSRKTRAKQRASLGESSIGVDPLNSLAFGKNHFAIGEDDEELEKVISITSLREIGINII